MWQFYRGEVANLDAAVKYLTFSYSLLNHYFITVILSFCEISVNFCEIFYDTFKALYRIFTVNRIAT